MTGKMRFTDTGKWDDGWYGNLDPNFKLAWDYINDRCDNAGVWDPNFRIANMHIGGSREGFKVDWDEFLKVAGYRIEILPNGKWWNTKHIMFQCRSQLSFYGKNGPNRPHIFIYNLLRSHGIVERYAEIEQRLFGRTFLLSISPESPENGSRPGFVQPKALTGDQQTLALSADSPTPRNVLAKGILEHLNELAKRKFSHSTENLKLIEHCLKETSDDAEGLKKMVSRSCEMWIGGEYEEYLRPSTLFAKKKWRERYEMRDVPVQKKLSPPQVQRNHEGGF